MILVGHVLDRLRELPAESVHCVVTSPPYYGLRDYDIEPQVWSSDPGCEHEWAEETVKSDLRTQGAGGAVFHGGNGHKQSWQSVRGFCLHCNAWRGSLGLEPTLDLYLDHMVEICREIRRVLRKDGTFWLNIGDSFAGSSSGGFRPGSGRADGIVDQRGQRNRNGNGSTGFKPKDLMMIPSRLAIRLQEDGWWVRSDIAWCKKSAMPESCTNRPTSAWEHVFLLTKSAKYFYDADAVREDWADERQGDPGPAVSKYEAIGNLRYTNRRFTAPQTSGRNLRNYWLLGPEPFPEAHFACFPSEIPRRAIRAGTSGKGVCCECGAPWERVVQKEFTPQTDVSLERGVKGAPSQKPMDKSNMWQGFPRGTIEAQTIGWQPTCQCNAPVTPATVLDPFFGSGTTGWVANELNRNWIGIELSPQYAKLAEARIAGMIKHRPKKIESGGLLDMIDG